MKKKYLLCAVVILFITSCSDFLDKDPDPRADFRTPKQISELLVYAYNQSNYALIGELSSDNMIDNTSPDDKGNYQNVSSRDRYHDELFAWEPVVSSTATDSPSGTWEQCYYAIAIANHALKAIEKIEADKNNNADVSAQKGEALLSRAYHHFILVNIFSHAYKDETASQNDLGIPYVTEPENTVIVHYNRGTVADVYKKIEKDITDGIDLIDDSSYEVAKYHFNKSAAHAFAARFYLFKRDYAKVIHHADIVLGKSPKFRDWKVSLPSNESHIYWYINASSANNLLIIPTFSVFNRVFGTRYGVARDAYNGTLRVGQGPSGRTTSCFSGKTYFRQNQDLGSFLLAAGGELFEYTDKVAGIGYPHCVRVEFTTEETLLCRAEAKIHLGLKQQAIDDFVLYEESRNTGNNAISLSEETITNYFQGGRKGTFYKDLNTEKMSPAWVVDPTVEALVHCVLFYRRVETIHNGMRWFDIKRYGIEIAHQIGASKVDTLKWNDERRAIQIPAEVLSAGVEPNPHPKTTPNNSIIMPVDAFAEFAGSEIDKHEL